MQPSSPQVEVWPRGTDRVYTATVDGPGGVAASTIGQLAECKVSTVYGPNLIGGEDLLEWAIQPYGNFLGGMFRPGDHVRVTRGSGALVGEGEFSQVVPGENGSVKFLANGYRYNFYDHDAVRYNSTPSPDQFYPTMDFDHAWAYAHDEALWPIRTYTGITAPFGAFGVSPWPGSTMSDKLYKMGDLLQNILAPDSKRACVWGRTLVVGTDDMAPIWLYESPESVVGVADTDYLSELKLLYMIDPTDPGYGGYTVNPDGSMVSTYTDAATVERFDVRQGWADWRGAGVMTKANADALVVALMDQVKGRFIYTGSFTVTPNSGLKSITGGLLSDLSQVRAGRAVTLPGLRTDQGQWMPDGDTFLIGQTDWSWVPEGETLQVTPMGAVARDLSAILTAPSATDPLKPYSRQSAA
jgi:hypothetical protein